MSVHKFKIGQFVNYNPRSKFGTGVYQIAQLMPPAGDEPQYRIKSESGAICALPWNPSSRTSTAADWTTRSSPVDLALSIPETQI